MYGQMSHAMETNGTLDLSPVANDDSVEGADVDDDDQYSKRRYCGLMKFPYLLPSILSIC